MEAPMAKNKQYGRRTKMPANTFLTGQEINNIVTDSGDSRSTSVSLDLVVDCVIKQGEIINLPKIKIKPQEMFIVILKGKVAIPNDCFGIALPKTRLCQEGVHILNTGLIDPGYEGFLSTVAINFSNKTVEIRDDDVFLRIVLYKNNGQYDQPSPSTPLNVSYDDYIKRRIRDSFNYPETFLDVPKQIENLSNKMAGLISSNMMNRGLWVLTLVTVGIAIISYILGNSNLQKIQDSTLQRSSEVIEKKTNEEIKKLENKYNELLNTVNSKLNQPIKIESNPKGTSGDNND